MAKKAAAVILFIIVTAGFFGGFISYRARLNKMISKDIEQVSVLEPAVPGDEPEEVETPVEVPDPPPGDPEDPPEGEPDEMVSIPNIIGMTEEDAVMTLEEAGLQPEAHYEYIDSVEQGRIFYQRPPRESEVARGTKVAFSVSRGAYGEDKVAVPDMAGKTVREAEALLQGLKLKYTTLDVYSASAGKGIIISQHIRSGTLVDAGTVITLRVSLGKEMSDVPNVIGMKEGDAKAALQSKGFVARLSKEHNSSAAAGNVIRQSLTGRAEKGAAVTIVISVGPEAPPVTEPETPEPVDPEPTAPIEEPVETPQAP